MSTEGAGGQKSQNLVNVVKECPLTLIPIIMLQTNGPSLKKSKRYILFLYETIMSPKKYESLDNNSDALQLAVF